MQFFRDCLDAKEKNPSAKDGLYLASLNPVSTPFRASALLCQMEEERGAEELGGGWTVIQRRGQFGNPIDFFDRVSGIAEKQIT